MENKINRINALANGCVVLVDRDQDRINYLKNIIQFIDYRIEIAKDSSELKMRLFDQEEDVCLTVLLGQDLSNSEVDQLLKMTDQAPLKPAILLMKSETGVVLNYKSDARFLGTLK